MLKERKLALIAVFITIIVLSAITVISNTINEKPVPPVKTNIEPQKGITSTDPDRLIDSLTYKQPNEPIKLTNAQKYIDMFPYLKVDAVNKVLEIQKEDSCSWIMSNIKALIETAKSYEKGSKSAMYVESVLGMWGERAQELNCQWK